MIELFENIKNDLDNFLQSVYVKKEDNEKLEGDNEELEEI